MGRKLLVVMGMEGKFSAEGLQAEGEDDLLMAMARELVTEQRIGETAEVAWRHIQAQNEAFAQRDSRAVGPHQEIVRSSEDEPLFPPQPPLPAVVDQLLLFGASLAAASDRKRPARRRPTTVSDGAAQLGLF